MIFFLKYESFSATLLRSKCERGCTCVFPVVPFGWENSDLAESANLLEANRFTWPCPRPQPSPFYPSGRPISANLSSAPATHNMAPERQKGWI